MNFFRVEQKENWANEQFVHSCAKGNTASSANPNQSKKNVDCRDKSIQK